MRIVEESDVQNNRRGIGMLHSSFVFFFEEAFKSSVFDARIVLSTNIYILHVPKIYKRDSKDQFQFQIFSFGKHPRRVKVTHTRTRHTHSHC